MSIAHRYIFRPLSTLFRTGSWRPPMYNSDRYKPSVEDVLSVKEFLGSISSFPLELIDTVIDFAEYWPHTSTAITTPTIARAQNQENILVLRSYPIGFLPDSDSSNGGHQILPEDQENYETMEPHPSPDSPIASESITQEVLDHMTLKSKSRGDHPCRKIVFTIKSHDQGWGGGRRDVNNPYHGSYTWFDVGLEKLTAYQESALPEEGKLLPQFRLGSDNPDGNSSPIVCTLRTILPRTVARQDSATPSETSYQFDHPLLPAEMALQKNVMAERTAKEHVVTWSYFDNIDPESPEADQLETKGRGRASATGQWVRDLKVGDVVTVWAKARFPGWSNHIQALKIDVYWAV